MNRTKKLLKFITNNQHGISISISKSISSPSEKLTERQKIDRKTMQEHCLPNAKLLVNPVEKFVIHNIYNHGTSILEEIRVLVVRVVSEIVMAG